MKRIEAIVYGRVQGVSYRYYTQHEADKLGVVGWVANQRDGTVRVLAEGEEASLLKLADFLHRGSPSAYVNKVDVTWNVATGDYSRFSIRWM